MDRDFLSIVSSRHCKRSFLGRQPSARILAEVLRAAAHAPSTRNSQLWQVAVVSGAARDELVRGLCADFDSGVEPQPDYVNRPPTPDEVSAQRAGAAAAGVLLAKGIAREDHAARRTHLRDNFRFYGAPAAMIFHLPRDAAPGTFLEMGCFLQNVMLGLTANGLGSCPQYSVAGYSETVRKRLDLGADRLIVCSLAVGYPDESAPVNHFVPDRAPLDQYTLWYA